MSYKTILVHLNDVRRAKRLLEASVDLARRQDAHLIGMATAPLPAPYYFSDMADPTLVEIVEEKQQEYVRMAQSLGDMFREATKDLQRPSEWHAIETGTPGIASTLVKYARTAELVIASQSDPEWAESQMLEAPEQLAMSAARPVILIPNSGPHLLAPKRATIAWNGSREAARAVFDALPLLEATEEVNVLWLNPEADPATAEDLPGAGLSATLARRGIKCVISRASAPHGAEGEELMRQCRAFGAELLVMGFYGHTRLREFILGGVSRHVLNNATIPVLLSH